MVRPMIRPRRRTVTGSLGLAVGAWVLTGGSVLAGQFPEVTRIDQTLDVVLSEDGSRQLVIFGESNQKWRGNSRIILMETATQREVATLRHGTCAVVSYRGEVPVWTDQVTMICNQSVNPAAKSRRGEIALLTLEVQTGKVLRWFPLGGRRHSMAFGPMFFGYWDDAVLIRAEKRAACPAVQPDVDLAAVTGSPDSAMPGLIFVIARRDRAREFNRWDVWELPSNVTDMPRLIVTLPGDPTAADLCSPADQTHRRARLLYVFHAITPATQALPPGFRLASGRVDVVDLVNGRPLTPGDTAR